MAASPPPRQGVPAATEPFEAFVVRRGDEVGRGGAAKAREPRSRRGPEPAGSLEELTLEDLPPGDVLVRVEWSTVNYKDAMVCVPGNRVARTSPLVPGVDLAGVVLRSDRDDLTPGTAVMAHGHDIGVARHGGYCGFARLPSEWVLPLPPALSARRAMAIGTAGFTAALSVDELELHGLEPGAGPVLVTGASGGVGSFSVALLAARGYEVVASTGRTEEHEWLRGLGASKVVGRDALDEAPARVLGPERWAGAVDCVGGDTLAKVVRSLSYGAAVAASGLTGGTELATNVYPFITRNVALLGIDSVLTARRRRRQVWERLAEELEPAAVDRLVETEVGLDGLLEVLGRILAGRVRGRVLVRVGTGGS